MNQLTQKEQTLLKDGVALEELCIRKYGDYASRAQDQQLKQMFNQHRADEVQHYQTLTSILGQGGQGGQMGQMGQGQMGQAGQSLSGQSQSAPGGQGSQFGQGVQSSTNEDVGMVRDLLMTEDFVSSAYDTAIFQVNDSQLRQNLEHIQKDEHKHGEDLANYLQQQGVSG